MVLLVSVVVMVVVLAPVVVEVGMVEQLDLAQVAVLVMFIHLLLHQTILLDVN